MQNKLDLIDKKYLKILEEAKQKISSSRINLTRIVTREQFNLYWWIGQKISDAQNEHGWGKAVVEQLSKDLRRAFPDVTHGFSSRNLWDMRRIYLEYKDYPNLRQLVAEIPWGQNLVILNKIKDISSRQYYLEMTHQHGWTRNNLLLQINSQAYERHITSPKQNNFINVLPNNLAQQAHHSMKDVYMLDTLGLTTPVLEQEIENRMVSKIKTVMLELGYGFSFIGNQYRILAEGNEYFIDLLFYNRRLQALVALELKRGEFQPEYAGKMNFYLNLLDDYVREPHENPSIGIILCSERNRFEVEYALRGINKPVGVSEFRLSKTLPAEFTNKLPNPNELEEVILKELGNEEISELKESTMK